MYGKIFVQIYDGSLYGRWQALVTFQQLIVLADQDGVVDMMQEAIAARTSIPIEIIRQGIAELEEPDPKSRTPDEDGRRIVRLSDGRDWGWQITNYAHYRAIRTAEERREYFKEHKRKQRAKKGTAVNHSPPLSTASPQSPPIVEVEVEVEVEAEVKKASPAASRKANGNRSASAIVTQIREMIETNSPPGQAAVRFIRRDKVAALGEEVYAAYDRIGGSDRFLKAEGRDWSFIPRELGEALADLRKEKGMDP